MGNLARAAAPTPDVGRGGLGPGFYAGSELRILCGPNSGKRKIRRGFGIAEPTPPRRAWDAFVQVAVHRSGAEVARECRASRGVRRGRAGR